MSDGGLYRLLKPFCLGAVLFNLFPLNGNVMSLSCIFPSFLSNSLT